MALDNMTKVRIRRLLGIPASGIPSSGTTMGLRTITRAGELELYMNSLAPEEEATLLGRPYGAFLIYGPATSGRVYTATVNSTVVTYTTQSSDLSAVDPLQSVAAGLRAAMVAALSNILVSSSAIAMVAQGNGYLSQAIQFALQSITTPFTLAATNAIVIAEGVAFPDPAYTIDDGGGVPANATVAYGLLPVCIALESQLLNASQNLSFSKVGADTTGAAAFRPDELNVRNQLFKKMKYELGVFMAFYPAVTAMQSPTIRV